MKRLFSILLMNAWSSLTHKASLPTMGMVAVSVMALVVASTVTVGASPDAALSSAAKVASAVPKELAHLSLPLLGDSGTTTHTTKSTPKKSTENTQPSGANDSSTTNENGSSSDSTSGNQGNTQSALATLSFSPTLSCQSGTTTYAVTTAELDLQTPPTASGTVTWYWETREDSSSSSQQSTTSSSSSQTVNAGESKITLSGTTTSSTTSGASSPQPLYTITSNSSTAYSFRLHVTGLADVTSSWFNVPVSTASCPTTSSSTSSNQ